MTDPNLVTAVSVRLASLSDLKALTEIYNHEILNGVATFDIEPKSVEQLRSWFDAHNRDHHPLLVAELEGTVVGYASLSGYRDKEAFAATVELSVYVHHRYRQRGVATALLTEILKIAREDPLIHHVISVITSGNEVSCALHQKFGFTFCGTLPEVGYKFGRLLGVDNYCLLV